MSVQTIKDQQELIGLITKAIGKNHAVEISDALYRQGFDLNELMAVTFHPEKEIAFRAAWIMENLILADPARFVNSLDKLIQLFLKNENKSCQRHYVKILMHLLERKVPKNIKQKIVEMDMGPVAERCFDLLIDATTPDAVKVFASQVLFDLRVRYPWINDMLADQLLIMMQGAKPAIRSKCQRLLSYLA